MEGEKQWNYHKPRLISEPDVVKIHAFLVWSTIISWNGLVVVSNLKEINFGLLI